MFRKIALITMAVVLGLAVFAGCSNDAVTSSTGSGTGEEKTTKWIKGLVTEGGLQRTPVEGAYIYILYEGNPTSYYDYSDADGLYDVSLINADDGDYTAICVKDPADRNSPELEHEFELPPWHHTWTFEFP